MVYETHYRWDIDPRTAIELARAVIPLLHLNDNVRVFGGRGQGSAALASGVIFPLE